MRPVTILLAAIPLLVQEDEAIRELIRRLDHDDFAIREQAQKDLIQRGEAALPLLKKTVEELEGRSERAESRLRAETAVREIELALRARRVYWDPKTITLNLRDAPLGDVLQEIARQAGIRIDTSVVDRNARVSVTAESSPLLRVLDDLCRGQAERTYEYVGDGEIRFLKDRPPAGPAFYSGPFRVRLVSLRVERSTDFKDRRCSLTLALEADCERYLKPLRPVSIEVDRIEDDRGGVLEKGVESGPMAVGRARVFVQAFAGGFNPTEPSAPYEFHFHMLSPAARSVTLQGTMLYSFPLDVREVTFEKLQSGESVEAADWQIRIDVQETKMDRGETKVRNVMIHFKPLRSPAGASAATIDPRLDLGSLVGVDEDGEEHKGQFHPTGMGNILIRAGGGIVPGQEVFRTYQTIFPTLRLKGLRKIRFRLTDPVLNKAVPFRLERVELP